MTISQFRRGFCHGLRRDPRQTRVPVPQCSQCGTVTPQISGDETGKLRPVGQRSVDPAPGSAE